MFRAFSWGPSVRRACLSLILVAVAGWLLSPSPAFAQNYGCQRCVYHLFCYAQDCWIEAECESPGKWGRCEIWPLGSCVEENICKWATLIPSSSEKLPNLSSSPVEGDDPSAHQAELPTRPSVETARTCGSTET